MWSDGEPLPGACRDFENRGRKDMDKTYNLTLYYTVTYKKTFQVQAPADPDLAGDVLNDKAYEIISESNCADWDYAGDPDIDFDFEED